PRKERSFKTPRDNLSPEQVKTADQRIPSSSDRRLYKLLETITARIQALENYDLAHGQPKCQHHGSRHETTHISDVDTNRSLYKMFETVLARVTILDSRRDICYRHAFKTAEKKECMLLFEPLSSRPAMDSFRVRLNCLDYYLSMPTEFDPELPKSRVPSDEQSLTKVPVIRVFGATETGQKVCAHVHGAFPYLYVEYHGSLVLEDVNLYINRLRLSIDHALAVSYRRSLYSKHGIFVAHISAIKGTPFYGYRVGHQVFLKIYLFDPHHVTRLADLLRQGAIMKKILQPYESHMQYLPQWMCDYNLYGCAYLDCKEARFRSPVPESKHLNNTKHKWHNRSISPSMILDEVKFQKQSHCSIEVDLYVQNILNRLDVKPRLLHHDFIEHKRLFSTDEKLVHSMAELWRDETKRRKTRMGLVDPNSSPFPPEVLVSMSADLRASQSGGWVHEDEFRAKLEEIIAEERMESDGKKLSFNSFVKKSSFEDSIKTSLEGVEDLFPENLSQLVDSNKGSSGTEDLNQTLFDNVDMSLALSFNEDERQNESDEDRAHEIQLLPLRKENAVDERPAEDGKEGFRLETNKSSSEMLDGDMHTMHTLKRAKSAAKASSGAQTNTNSSSFSSVGSKVTNPSVIDGNNLFQIPVEFASDLSTPTRLIESNKGPSSRSDYPSKRVKLQSNASRTTNSDPEVDVNDTRNAMKSQGQLNISLLDGSAAEEAHRGQPLKLNNGHDYHDLSRGSHKSLGSATQVKLRRIAQDGERSPSFPSVKDLRSPKAIPRLSQKNTSPNKPPESSSCLPSNNIQQSESVGSENRHMSSTGSLPTVASYSDPPFLLATKVYDTFAIPNSLRLMVLASNPPKPSDMLSGMQEVKVPLVIYQDAYYSDDRDVPDRPREYAGKEFRVESATIPYLPNFDPDGISLATVGEKQNVVIDKAVEEKQFKKQSRACSLRCWSIGTHSPPRQEIELWLQQSERPSLEENPKTEKPYCKDNVSQIEAATQKHAHGFKYSQKRKSSNVRHETQYMSVMSLEVHANTRGKKLPDPEFDRIDCIFWAIRYNDEDANIDGARDSKQMGFVTLSEHDGLAHSIPHQDSTVVEEETTELDLITHFVDIVRNYDPDILTGYEVHGSSWGYMIERARRQFDINLCDELSRMRSLSHGRSGKEGDRWGFNQTSAIRVTGRHIINIWRAMRGELNLLQYTMENVVFHLLHRRIPHYSYQDLTKWFTSGRPKDLAIVVDYFSTRVQVDLDILEQNELIQRTSEQARLLGVDFYSVFSRGSQFKVESLMFRIAKPENLLLPSPSRKQVGQQNALECLPLVMEPQSAFYNSPLLVLDFQSLYPSVMIAYNYCYSTFLGRLINWRGKSKMGFTDYEREQRLLELLEDQINIAPNGIMYVKPNMRKSLLAKMLGEILETRVMVKHSMKCDKDDQALQRLLNNRQLALKLIANVTYGYTSASFSGRMPCSEIADSIVQTARETLEKAIALIHSVGRWRAEVVYGDTDSLFVYLKGRTKDEAFDIGNEIAKTITDMNPRPVKLKFEKVYLPCVLLAKKRYVGFKYESKSQVEPDFDAKGIETVRRDGTPAEQKIEEKALRILFRTSDLSQVKRYFQSQCTKIMKGKVSIQDFCFSKEVRLGTYNEKGVPPPGALISAKKMLEDARAEPQYGERVPYVVISGPPGSRLIDRCVAPDVLLYNDYNELDADYYISKNLIPPLERIFNLLGGNVRQWYDEMPKFQRIRRIDNVSLPQEKDINVSKKTLEAYMKSSACLVCCEKLEDESPVCHMCLQRVETSLLTLRSRHNKMEQKAININKICRSCAGIGWGEEMKCDSNDCPVFYTRTRHVAGLRTMQTGIEPVLKLLEEVGGGALNW
ncbi:MAG: hypothetical protein Q9214_001265, partial [Letrouitia sp. 1 TL-2023]